MDNVTKSTMRELLDRCFTRMSLDHVRTFRYLAQLDLDVVKECPGTPDLEVAFLELAINESNDFYHRNKEFK